MGSVSRLSLFLEAHEGRFLTVGIDVHARQYHVALLADDGANHVYVAPADAERLADKLAKLKVRCVAYESGPTGFGLARELMEHGIKVIVAAPSRIPRPATTGAKTDRLDCLMLANFAAKGLIKSIALPTEDEEAKRGLVRRRHTASQALTKAKQRIKLLLLQHGHSLPRGQWSAQTVAAMRNLPLHEAVKETLESLLREYDFHQAETKNLMRRLGEIDEEEAVQLRLKYLQTVPGVGRVVAETFCRELFRPERFNRAEEVASYLGLAPTVRHSGEGKRQARLRPGGQKKLRSLLVEAAWVWKRKSSQAETIYKRILSRTGLAQKAIVAVARKLAIVLWRLCVEIRPYRAA